MKSIEQQQIDFTDTILKDKDAVLSAARPALSLALNNYGELMVWAENASKWIQEAMSGEVCQCGDFSTCESCLKGRDLYFEFHQGK